MGNLKHPTLKQISEATGYSLITISRAINCPNKLKPKTLETVLKAIEEVGYSPNNVAKALTSGKTNIVYIYIPDDIPSTNLFFMNVVAGIGETLGEYGYSMLVRKKWYHNEVCDGIIMMGLGKDDEARAKELANKKHVVLFGHIDDVDSMDIDNYQGTNMITEYAISKGYQNLLYLSIDQIRNFINDREKGFLDAVREYPTINYQIDRCLNKTSSAYKFMHNNFFKYEDVDCIVCASDDIALGVVQFLKENNIKIPEEIAVSGFDGLGAEKASMPKITTVRQPIYEIGKLLAKRLIDKMENDELKNELRFVSPILIKNETL